MQPVLFPADVPVKMIIPQQMDSYQIGAILEDQWGYEQTNIEYYCIIKRNGCWITVQPMDKAVSDETSFMTRKCTPTVMNTRKSPIRKKLRIYQGKEQGFSFRNYTGGGWCRLWDGKPGTSTHYA